jgi:dolichol-phosphate mannosyltransferase
MISIIIPTYNEKDNLEPLLSQLSVALERIDEPHEIVVVDDDSPDGTAREAERLGSRHPVSVVIRKDERGLATAVMRGFAEARGDIIAVMDADMSHDPAYVVDLYEALQGRQADMVVGSRFIEGGRTENWSRWRGLVSWVARTLSRGICPVKDSTSGFFMFRRSMLDGVDLKPVGYKIGLEMLIKCPVGNVIEVPIVFKDRAFGHSKLGSRNTLLYLGHLVALYWWILRRADPTRQVGPILTFARFSLVGLSGVVVNYGLFRFLRLVPGLSYLVAAFLAIEVSILSNFFLNHFWTWRHRLRPGVRPFLSRAAKYHIVAGIAAFGGNWGTLYVLAELFGFQVDFSYLTGIGVGMLINFFLNDRWTFARALWRNNA